MKPKSLFKDSNRSLFLLMLFAYIFGAVQTAVAQNPQVALRDRPSPKISLVDFNKKVDKSILLLKIKKLTAISDKDHIDIMMCSNTVTFLHEYDYSKPIIKKVGLDSFKIYKRLDRFLAGRYKELKVVLEKTDYARNITKVYRDYTFNNGLGYYFPALKMELFGTPEPYSMFEVARR